MVHVHGTCRTLQFLMQPDLPGLRKVRVDFDAAAAVNGMKRPILTATITMFQFREGVLVVCADIREMFFQVRVREEDRSSIRFL